MDNNSYIMPAEISEQGVFSKYHQIYTQLKKELFFRDYQKGSRFFSLRGLKKIYQADPRTIRAAVELLIRDGFIESRSSSGFYVTGAEKRNPYVSMGNIWFYQPGENNTPYYYGVLSSLQRQAAVTHQNVIINHVTDINGFKAWFQPESGDGLVVTGDFSHDVLKYLLKINFKRFLVLGNYELPEGIPNLRSNIKKAIRSSIDNLKHIGRNKLSVIVSSKSLLSVKELMTVVYEADNNGDIKYIGGFFNFKEDGYMGMQSLRGKDYDSIIVSESSYPGFCRYVYENNIRCPNDIFVVRYGKNIEFENFYELAGMTIVSDKDKMARRVISRLFHDDVDNSELEVDLRVNDTRRPEATTKTSRPPPACRLSASVLAQAGALLGAGRAKVSSESRR